MAGHQSNKKLITILSIDGGGIRRIIPSIILEKLETELQRLDGENARIADYFDIISGTSTGGLIASILAAPVDTSGRPRPAKDLVRFYNKEGPLIFSSDATCIKRVNDIQNTEKSTFKKILAIPKWAMAKVSATALAALYLPRYDGVHLRNKTRQLLGQTLLGRTLTNVVIPAYDIEKKLQPVIFSTSQAKRNNSELQLYDVVLSSSAAPYYFGPHMFMADGQEYNLVDGALTANNPALLAIHEASRDFPDADGSPPDYSNYLVLSLGTGSKKHYGHHFFFGGLRDWFNFENVIPPLVDVLFKSMDDMVDLYTSSLFHASNSSHNFLRIQEYTLDGESASNMDDATKENQDKLARIAEDLLNQNVQVTNPITGLRERTVDERKNGDALIEFAKILSKERKSRNGSLRGY